MIYDLKLPHWASLLNCPFCGGEAELVADGDGVYAGCATKQCLIKPITDTSNKTRCDSCVESEAIMTREQIARYQAESVKRANLPPVAKHSQTKTHQPQKEAA